MNVTIDASELLDRIERQAVRIAELERQLTEKNNERELAVAKNACDSLLHSMGDGLIAGQQGTLFMCRGQCGLAKKMRATDERITAGWDG